MIEKIIIYNIYLKHDKDILVSNQDYEKDILIFKKKHEKDILILNQEHDKDLKNIWLISLFKF